MAPSRMIMIIAIEIVKRDLGLVQSSDRFVRLVATAFVEVGGARGFPAVQVNWCNSARKSQ